MKQQQILPLVLATGFAVFLAGCQTRPSGVAQGEWRSWAGDKASTRYSPLAQINRDNVKNLKVAWRQSAMPDELAKTLPAPRPAPNNYQNTPLMANGLLYVSSGIGTVIALDPGTGKVVWFERPATEGPPALTSRGVAFWSGESDGRIIAVEGTDLVALNAKTGERIRDFGVNGKVDLRAGMSRSVGNYVWRSAPLIVRNVIVVGSVVSDINSANRVALKEGAPGDVRGYDVRTGKQLWNFTVIPPQGEFGSETWEQGSNVYSGAANAWATMSGDEELGQVYLPLSTPTDDWYGGHRPGANLFAESIVALDVATGKRLWHFQAVHHGLWDYDFPCPPILADITVNGRKIKALAQPSKQAMLYVFDRTNGKPVWPIEERPVPKGDVPGEWYSPTQPMPLDAHGKPFAYDQLGVSIDDLIDFTPELRQEAIRIINDYAFGPVFFPPVVPGSGMAAGKKGSIHMPGTYGGTNWYGAALDPETNVLYVPSAHTPIIVQLVPPPEGSNLNLVRRGWEPVVGPQKLPMFKPPYGRLVAIDLNKGEIKWTVANGEGPRDHAAIRDLNLPPLGNPGRTGPIVTKSLVFMGEGFDTSRAGGAPYGGGKMFRAFDKSTGAVVWEMELPAGQTAPAMTYSWQGKQYLVMATGWTDRPGELMALALE